MSYFYKYDLIHHFVKTLTSLDLHGIMSPDPGTAPVSQLGRFGMFVPMGMNEKLPKN